MVGLLRAGAAGLKKNEQQQRQKPRDDLGHKSAPVRRSIIGATKFAISSFRMAQALDS
jgi:hypothetical protein